MIYTPVTPFRRAVDAGMLAHRALIDEALPPEGIDKWAALTELRAARTRLGLSDRELTVLQALLSFHPEKVLGGERRDLVVHPSNASLQDRLNGMPGSTLRRHLAGLVSAGFIVRRDSPNGKRFVRRHAGEREAFGFDLSPLVRRFAEIREAAEATRAAEEAERRLRRTLGLMRRDLAGLAEFAASRHPEQADRWADHLDLCAQAGRALRRRRLTPDAVALAAALATALNDARDIIDGPAREPGANDPDTEQHHQSSKTDPTDLEHRPQRREDPDPGPQAPAEGQAADLIDVPATLRDDRPAVPLPLVLAACPEFRSYIPDPVRHWHELVRSAEVLRPMMGVTPSAWEDAIDAMGAETAAVVIVAMLERAAEIRSPGGYLRSLTRRARSGAFSCGPMVMALIRKEAA